MAQQLDLFAEMYPKYELKGKVLLIELFAGIGSQYRGLKLIEQAQEKQNIPQEDKIKVISHKICEWTYNSYVMYNLIHTRDFIDYSVGKTKEEMIERIKGTSTDYNKALSLDQLKRKPIEWIRTAYNSCIATHNLVDITQVKGRDLDFTDNTNQTIIMTYSFPCQDISGSGKMSGLAKGGGTRSGLLWEVERILIERERERLPLPNCLLMENVDMLLSQKFIKSFIDWEQKLASMGYSNYVQVLNAKDYSIPQNRKRVFMISLLGQYHYYFPRKQPLRYKLKNFLDKNVDEKYYLSEKMINYISHTGTKDFSVNNAEINKQVARPLTTEQNKRAGTTNYICNELPEDTDLQKINIKNNTEKGYLEAQEGDGIDIGSRMEKHRGNVQKDTIQTILNTGGEERGVVVNEKQDKDRDNQETD